MDTMATPDIDTWSWVADQPLATPWFLHLLSGLQELSATCLFERFQSSGITRL